jgi:hypothetical protein
MGLEEGTYIDDLNIANPVGSTATTIYIRESVARFLCLTIGY